MYPWIRLARIGALAVVAGLVVAPLAPGHAAEPSATGDQVLNIGDRRELFVDDFLIDTMDGTTLKMHRPLYAPPCDKPPPQLAYSTVFKDGDAFRMYGRMSRGKMLPDSANTEDRWMQQVTVYAESPDGIHWTEPNLGIYDNVPEIEAGNVVLAYEFATTHNFTPFLDERPGVPPDQRHKGVGGMRKPKEPELVEKYGPGGLRVYVSPDGLHWRRLVDRPVIPNEWGAFDSQNVIFWSSHERCYVCYFRVFDNKYTPGVRSIRRSTSKDLIHWTEPVDVRMNRLSPGGPDQYGAKYEQLYVNNIKPYYRAPHITIGLPTRIDFNHNAATEVLLTSSRDGVRFDRRFTEPFLRPGVRVNRYYPSGNRGNYAAHQVIQTGPSELSLYTYDGRRFTLRLDGFASLHGPFAGGEMVTRPFVFSGEILEVNARTAGIGSIRVEIQQAGGEPIPGYTLAACEPMAGDCVAHVVKWRGGADVSKLAGKPIRLRLAMKDADLFSLRFAPWNRPPESGR